MPATAPLARLPTNVCSFEAFRFLSRRLILHFLERLFSSYNIDSLLTRYRGIDWRIRRDLQCNRQLNPQVENANDGLGLDPFEVVFVKGKALPKGQAMQNFLERYTHYFTGEDDYAASGFFSERVQDSLKADREALRKKVERCGARFDVGFYFKHNPDLVGVIPEEGALEHFTNAGFQERRPFNYISHDFHSDCQF